MGNIQSFKISEPLTYYQAHKETLNAKMKALYHANKEQHREKLNKRALAWYHANKSKTRPEVIAKRKEYSRIYYEVNKVEIHRKRAHIDDKLKRNKVYRSTGIKFHHIVMGGGGNTNEGNLVRFC
jgi:pyruvate/2-oxoglutarate dehydrogenase complex dihydrolipoamide dehydrogenase (E3) component